MKSLNNFYVRYKCLRNQSIFSFLAVLILFFTSCTSKPEPYSILEFTGIDAINNFSKSYMLILSESDSLNPAVIMGSNGDLFWCDEYLFQYNDPSSQNRFLFKYTDSVLYVNNKIYSIDYPGQR